MTGMLAFEADEQQGPADYTTRTPFRELRWVVVCPSCRGGWLWRCRKEELARELVVGHAAWSGHAVRVELREV